MEIGSVTGIPGVPQVRAVGTKAKSGKEPVFDLESLTRTDDETYTPNEEATGGSEDEDFYEPEAESEDKIDAETSLAKDEETGQVSFFA